MAHKYLIAAPIRVCYNPAMGRPTTMTPSTPASAVEEEVPITRSVEQSTTRRLKKVHLWAIALLSVVWFAAGIEAIEPYDFWWNAKSGEIMAQTGRFLSQDVLVWTPVRMPYSNPQWGAQLLSYWLHDASPYLALTARAVIVTAATGLLLWLVVWRTGSLRIATLVTLLAYFTGWTNYGMRPQLFAFLPFMVYLFLLERKDAHPRWLPLLVPVMLFWVNVHGSFFLGVGLLGIYALGTLLEKWSSPQGRRWLRSRAAGWQALWAALATLTTLANPYGAGIYNYFFAATNDPIARSLNIEWQAPTIYEGTGILFFLNITVFLIALYLGRRRLRPTEILLIAAFSYLALTSLRNVLWWGWVTAPIVAANFAHWRRAGTRGQTPQEEPAASKELPAFNWAIAAILVGGALLFTPLWRPANPLVPATSRAALAESTPVELAAFVKSAGVPAPLFNYMEWGGYLEWELYPRYQMFIDGRFEARQIQVWRDYLAISRARADWQDLVARYGVRTLILSKEFHKDLIPFVAASNSWKRAYEDELGVVFTRR